ncbi:hypothetical protein ACVCAH_10635 [Micromonospora sp. LZ34]
MDGDGFAAWRRDFEQEARRRAGLTEPPWADGGPLDPAVVRSIQRFQAGEDGDGASLIARAGQVGGPDYLAAVRLFVAEEQHHARLLERLLRNAGAGTIPGHWSDRVFVAVRRCAGLRLELLTLMVAEVVALRYYRALRDGTTDPALTEVAGRILADERRHVPFHVDRLRAGFVATPAPARWLAAAAWWVLLLGATAVVAVDHGAALRRLGLTRAGFLRDTAAMFRPLVADVFRRPRRRQPVSR